MIRFIRSLGKAMQNFKKIGMYCFLRKVCSGNNYLFSLDFAQIGSEPKVMMPEIV
jgi:hypothetical protein|tara:strand:- start:462 stop:626 length:165 start_codon:yes stop_codon:yes gene_type:complete